MKSITLFCLLPLFIVGCDRQPPTSSPVSPPPATVATAPPAIPAPPLPAPLAPAQPVGAEQLAQAFALKKEGKLLEARSLLQPLAQLTNTTDQVLTALGELNMHLLLSPAPLPGRTNLTVQAGDALGKLAKQFGTTIELIKKSNGLSSDLIRIGDRLRIYTGKFSVKVGKTDNTLTLLDDGLFFKRYRVGTGQYSKTPVGEFKIVSRMEQPVWYRPDGEAVPFGDPANILGTHWLGLDLPRYGIHGTWDTNSIGKQASAGCVRLLNDDVAELYIILPIGTPVQIHE
jgi:lipoprotein-anchoring transpeptidase ErfK/SrfK